MADLQKRYESYFDVILHPLVKDWCKTQIDNNTLAFKQLSGNNVDTIRNWLGDTKIKSKDPKSLLWEYGWVISHNGLKFNILTGAWGTRILCFAQTSREEFLEDPEIGIAINSFLELLMVNITGVY